METQHQQVDHRQDAEPTEAKRDAGVYLIIARDKEGQLFFGELPTKKAASIAYAGIVEQHGANSVIAFYKQAKKVQVQTKTVASF